MAHLDTKYLDGWEIHPQLNRCERDGRTVQLSPRTMDVLVYLLEHAGEVVSRDELMAHVWQGRPVTDEQVYKRVGELRQAFRGSGDGGPVIETVPKRGYRLLGAAQQPRPSRIPTVRLAAATLVAAVAAVAVIAFIASDGTAPSRVPGETVTTAASTTTSDEAYSLYLKAGTADVSPGLPTSSQLVYLDQALDIDPQFALARARTANAHALALVDNMISGPANRDFERDARLSRQFAEEALALDPNLVEAHTALARLNQYTWYWQAAAANYRDAYRLNPDDIDLLRLYAHFASYTGQTALARTLAQHAIATSPDTPSLQFRVGTVALNEQNLGAAINAFERAITLDPKFANGHLYLGIALAAASRADEAVPELEVAETLLSQSPMPYQLSLLAYGYRRAEAYDQAAVILRRYADVAARYPDGPGSRIFAALADGATASAAESLRAALERVRQHEPDVSFNTLMLVKTNAFLDPVIGQDTVFKRLRTVFDETLGDVATTNVQSPVSESAQAQP